MSQNDVPLQLEPRFQESKVLLTAAVISVILEFSLVTVFGVREQWLSRRPKPAMDPTLFIEAQMIQAPEEPHLREEKKAAPAPPEAALSKRVDQGRKAKPNENVTPDQNQTTGGPRLGPTHGPVAVFTPAPVIPSYLQNELLKASVVIDFFVSAQGTVTPKLIGSSGNEELDALAISTAKRWQFKAAENASQPIDAKVRLRINFKVE